MRSSRFLFNCFSITHWPIYEKKLLFEKLPFSTKDWSAPGVVHQSLDSHWEANQVSGFPDSPSVGCAKDLKQYGFGRAPSYKGFSERKRMESHFAWGSSVKRLTPTRNNISPYKNRLTRARDFDFRKGKSRSEYSDNISLNYFSWLFSIRVYLLPY